nr:immunoglobulin heavy chain junction region [Mus musculus]
CAGSTGQYAMDYW